MRAFAIALASLTIACMSPVQGAPEQVRGIFSASESAATDFSAARRRKKPISRSRATNFQETRSTTHQAEQAQIACPRGGCRPVPRGCVREPERSFDGTPTGFDAIVCPMR